MRMLGPFSIAIIALISTGIVDTIYIARLTDPARPDLAIMGLAALGYVFPLTFMGNSANIGLGAGTNSAVSRALGQGDRDRASRHGAAAILLALTVMSCLAIFVLTCVPYLLPIVIERPEIQQMAYGYLLISYPGLIIISIASMSNNVLRAHGEAVLPSSIMILGAVINIILDPFLIFGIGPFPRMELQGAALSTNIGYTISAIYALYLVLIHRKIVSFAGMTFGSLKRAWKIIGEVGVFAAFTNIIVPVSVFIAVSILGLSLSEADVAAFTAASRAELISVGVLYALSACIGAITGRNGGAGKHERVRETFRVCYWICFIWSSLTAILMALFATEIAQVFTKDQILIDKMVPYFYIVPVTIFAYGFVFVSAAGLNALGRPLFGLSYTIIRSLILYIGFIVIGVSIAGLKGAFFGVAGANLLSGAVAILWTLRKAPMSAKLA